MNYNYGHYKAVKITERATDIDDVQIVMLQLGSPPIKVHDENIAYPSPISVIIRR